MAATLDEKPISKADRRRGYRIGCEGWATVAQAAELIGRSDRTVERLIEAGCLRAYKLSSSPKSHVRLCRRSVAEFIASREV